MHDITRKVFSDICPGIHAERFFAAAPFLRVTFQPQAPGSGGHPYGYGL